VRWPRRRVHTTSLLARRRIAERTVEVCLERPTGFVFEPGQYVQVRLAKLQHRDRKGRSRVFSIASSPLDEQQICVAYRETGSGFKQTLGNLPVGTEVLIEGPHGFASLPRSTARPLMLIAGGIGITPFMSMLRYAAETAEQPPRVTLLYANWTPQQAAYLDELEALERGNPRLAVRKHFGAVDQAAIRKLVKHGSGQLWLIAGPPAMVEATRSALHVLGVDADDVHVEEFVGY
jgi:ferredoxin-NADP reductase